MKQYPHIEYYGDYMNEPIYAFDKIDGSNIRFEWSHKRGFYKFGTKKCLIDRKSENFGDSIDLFLNKYNDSLDMIFRKNKLYRNIKNFIVFAEYFGDNTFAGQHIKTDKKDIILFEVNPYKKGFISPKEFLNEFGHLDIPRLIYHGNLNKEFIKNIKDNVYNLKEGVVCKWSRKTKGNDITMLCKIKTNEWLDRLKNKYGEEAVIKELSGKDII